MSEIADLERRITDALARIGQAMDKADDAPRTAAPDVAEGSSEAMAALQEALDAEKEANAQLTERVKAIKEKQDTLMQHNEKLIERQRAQLATFEADLTRLSRVNDQLRHNNEALRTANADGLADPHLINKAMLTELEALRAVRTADRDEIDAILSELKPLVGEGA
jgi:small-conductance mechanosensitive channel